MIDWSYSVGFPLSAVEDFGLNLNRLFRQSMEYLVKIQCSGAEYSLSQCILETVNFDDSTADVAAVQCVGKFFNLVATFPR